MTIVFERQLDGEEGTHALVIGVGSYPHLALPGLDPPDLESAVRGAIAFADCLIRHADALTPRLATLDLLLSPPGGVPATYLPPDGSLTAAGAVDPRPDASVEGAAEDNVEEAGLRWSTHLQATPDNVAVFYICGHGVATPSRMMVFLSDVKSKASRPWNPHVDVLVEAARLHRRSSVALGCFFIDACQEVIKEVDLAEADKQKIIRDPVEILPPGPDDENTNVYALVPGPRGALAWDDEHKVGGRFTQVLVQALDGAAACNFTGVGNWGVKLDDLHSRMKLLYGLNPLWADGKPFNPQPVYTPVARGPLVQFSSSPKVPVCIRFSPADILTSAISLNFVASTIPPDPQIFALTIDDHSGSASVSGWKDGIFIAWPKASFGSHRMRLSWRVLEDGVSASSGQTWRNPDRETAVDISEMRVTPVVVHDVS
ncbi:caspase family protein [Asticcacaulis sp. SL142]|uniref:caspase family protein n=1 Tax=Asticcacaulis sp. SL142 TaxID=2995155 RepID=UPI00226C87E7|nr:caspase family protein [Asticcacaulis sp. SL142]WAC49778.1 caspase family protein [Asticcacaulis sp. SL142]